MKKISIYDKAQIHFETADNFRNWLKVNHYKSDGIWLIFYKKDASKVSLTYPEAVDEAICYGWIDSLVKRIDNEHNIQYFAPRKAKSVWSAVNKGKIERLVSEGKMAEPGLLKIEIAKKDGSWTLLDDVEALVIPKDLQASLNKDSKAKTNFDNFPKSQKKMILWWIKSAKTDATRTKRIDETVEKSSQNIKVR